MHVMSAVDYVKKVSRIKADGGDDLEVRKTRWRELVCILEALETQYGYKSMDGREAYTRDKKEEHKSTYSDDGVPDKHDSRIEIYPHTIDRERPRVLETRRRDVRMLIFV